jgi:hypothetical protein
VRAARKAHVPAATGRAVPPNSLRTWKEASR